MKNLTMRVKMIDKNLPELEQKDYGNWIDLRVSRITGLADDIEPDCVEDVYTLSPGEVYLVRLGVAIELPEGYEAIVAPRSSTFKHYGLIQTNSVGVIDTSYCGDGDEWLFPCLATEPTTVRKGDRICQFRLLERMPLLNMEFCSTLGNKDRGGHGSTGKQ